MISIPVESMDGYSYNMLHACSYVDHVDNKSSKVVSLTLLDGDMITSNLFTKFGSFRPWT